MQNVKLIGDIADASELLCFLKTYRNPHQALESSSIDRPTPLVKPKSDRTHKPAKPEPTQKFLECLEARLKV